MGKQDMKHSNTTVLSKGISLGTTEWRDQNFHQGWYWDFFWDQNFWERDWDFFRIQKLWHWYRYFFESKIFDTEISFRPKFFRLIPIPFDVRLWWALDKHDRKMKPRNFLNFEVTLSNSNSMGKQKILTHNSYFESREMWSAWENSTWQYYMHGRKWFITNTQEHRIPANIFMCIFTIPC